MDKKTLVVVGAGRGLGNHVAETFGTQGFRVVLMARNRQALDAYVREFADKSVEAVGIAADAGDAASLTAAFRQVQDLIGADQAVDVLVYNACILEPGRPASLSAADLLRHYQVDVAGAQHSVLQVLPGMRRHRRGTILFTGGGFALYPSAEYTCVSVDKAALRALAMTLNTDLRDQGIFAGVVTIMGNIAPGTHFDPADIARVYWKLYAEGGEAETVFA